jgi:hypothetical protein
MGMEGIVAAGAPVKPRAQIIRANPLRKSELEIYIDLLGGLLSVPEALRPILLKWNISVFL